MILREDGEMGALGCGRGDERGGFEEVGFGVEGLVGQLAWDLRETMTRPQIIRADSSLK